MMSKMMIEAGIESRNTRLISSSSFLGIDPIQIPSWFTCSSGQRIMQFHGSRIFSRNWLAVRWTLRCANKVWMSKVESSSNEHFATMRSTNKIKLPF